MSKPTFLGPLIGKGVGQCELVYAERSSLLASRVEPAFDSKTRKQGLLGRESIPEDFAIVIAPCSAVHTCFMRVSIDVVFVSRNGTITKTCRGVRPWRMAGSMGAYAVIEAAEGFIDRHELVPGEVVALRETRHGGAATVPSPAGEPPPVVAPIPAVEPGTAPRRHTASRRRVTLADLIERRTPMAWFESVAVTQEVIATVLAPGRGGDSRVPELKHLAITADGTVDLLAEGPAWHSAVHRAGLVLLALTPEEELPPQLRVLVLEEVSPKPRLASLEDLYRELGFYERPDRRAIVRGVFERFGQSAEPDTRSNGVPAPLPGATPARRRGPSPSRRKAVAAGLAAGLVAAIALASAWAWRRPQGRWLRDGAVRASAATNEAVRTARDAASSGVAAVKRLAGIEVRTPGGPDAVGAPTEAAAGTAPDSGATPALQGRPLGSGLQEGAGGVSSPQVGLAATPDSGNWEALGWVRGSPAEAAASAPDTLSAAPAYSSSDAAVLAPDLVRPPLRKGLPPGVRMEDLPEVELVVSSTGEVESAKFVTPMRGVKATVMLSVVKAWHFEPATLDGKPVRYRLRVRLIG